MTEFADDVQVNWATAHQWRLRGYIPAEYWPRIVEKAKARGLKNVNLTVLAELASRRPPKAKRPSEPQRARVN